VAIGGLGQGNEKDGRMTITMKPPSVVAAPAQQAVLPGYDVRDIVEEGGQAHLILDGAVYTLRITRAGKLILTK